MTTFLYTGKRVDFDVSGVTDGNPNDHIVIWGVKFMRGFPTKVDDPTIAARLTTDGGHPYFTVVPDAENSAASSAKNAENEEAVNALMPKTNGKAKKG